MTQHIYLIRHCKAKGQAPEAPLTELGHKDAIKLANFLKDEGIEAIVSSPYIRAIGTAQPLADNLGLSIQTDERFSERVLSSENLPDWMKGLMATFDNLDLKYVGGESSSEAMARAITGLNEHLASDFQRIAVVTHGNLLSLILHYYDSSYGFESWKRLTNPDVFVLSFEESQIQIKRLWS